MSDSNSPKRYPLNVNGDFYVENEMCISCGAPEVAAPDLMAMDDGKSGLHCYFKKQPTNQEEEKRAIEAIYSSCCGGLRYASNNPIILNKLIEINMKDQCDIFSK